MNLQTFQPGVLLLATCAALSFSVGALAAEVSVHGLIDLGLNVQRVDDGHERSTTAQMMSGQNAMSRVSLRGSEDLGNGWKLAFWLENGFDADTGAMKANLNNALFGREASIAVSGPIGEMKMGRLTSVLSGYNSTGLFGPKVSPFSTLWVGVPGHKSVTTGGYLPMDNMLHYTTPDLAGWKAHVQYSFGSNQKKLTDAELVHRS